MVGASVKWPVPSLIRISLRSPVSVAAFVGIDVRAAEDVEVAVVVDVADAREVRRAILRRRPAADLEEPALLRRVDELPAAGPVRAIHEHPDELRRRADRLAVVAPDRVDDEIGIPVAVEVGRHDAVADDTVARPHACVASTKVVPLVPCGSHVGPESPASGFPLFPPLHAANPTKDKAAGTSTQSFMPDMMTALPWLKFSPASWLSRRKIVAGTVQSFALFGGRCLLTNRVSRRIFRTRNFRRRTTCRICGSTDASPSSPAPAMASAARTRCCSRRAARRSSSTISAAARRRGQGLGGRRQGRRGDQGRGRRGRRQLRLGRGRRQDRPDARSTRSGASTSSSTTPASSATRRSRR